MMRMIKKSVFSARNPYSIGKVDLYLLVINLEMDKLGLRNHNPIHLDRNLINGCVE